MPGREPVLLCSGIGRALALELAQHSPLLALVGRRGEPLEEVAELVRQKGAQAVVIPADVTAPGAAAEVVSAAQEHLGGIDVLINNAGNVRAGRLETLEESEVLAQIALNLSAPILLARAALPALRASGEGLVVNVSSGIGLIGMPFYATYAATKAGVARATIEGIIDGDLNVIRGGGSRAQMVALNRDDPAAVDRILAEARTIWKKPWPTTPASDLWVPGGQPPETLSWCRSDRPPSSGRRAVRPAGTAWHGPARCWRFLSPPATSIGWAHHPSLLAPQERWGS